jgi:FlaG/FlaF family flagellin (archaellin)
MRIHQDNRAISAVLATMLMIIITCLAGIVLYSFGIGMIEDITDSDSMKPFSLSIDAVSFNSTCMQIYVRNGLDRDISVKKLFINKKAYDVYTSSYCFDTIPEGATVPIHVLGSFSDGCMYNVKMNFDSGHSILYPIV